MLPNPDKCLGVGTMARVLTCLNYDDDKLYAVKIIKKQYN